MTARAALAAALVMAAAGAASSSPAVIPAERPAVDGAQVEVVAGALHHFEHRWFYVMTAAIAPELALSDTVSLVGTVPLATVQRDGEVAAGWGNLGAGVRLRAVRGAGDARWIGALTLHASAPTALDSGGAGDAARSAALVHEPLDLGDFMPGTFSARIAASLRWQGARWWFAAALANRLHVFLFDRGEPEFWQPVNVTLGAGYRASARSSFAATLDTSSDLLDVRSGEGDHFRHLARVSFERRYTIWQLEAAVLVPLDYVVLDDLSPMLSVNLRRNLGG